MTNSSAAPSAGQDQVANVHQIFSQKVQDYLKSRPDYPAALFDRLAECGALPNNAVIADIGSGTGSLTKSLLDLGHEVFALEPNDEMRQAAERILIDYPGFWSSAGSAEQTGLPDSSVDLVTAAQAFHWFDAPRARDECLRILRPHGRVALIWNDRVLSDPLNQGLDQVLSGFGGALRKVSMQQEELRQVPLFFGGSSYSSFEFEHGHWMDRSGLEALVFSRSYMPARNSEAGRAAERSVLQIFNDHAQAGRVLMRYVTLALVGRPGR